MRNYDPDIGARVVEMIGDGQGLQTACVALNVPRRTVRTWAAEQPDFAKALHEARRLGLEVLADQIISIADAVEGCLDVAVVQAARLRVESRKWLLSKLNPGQYGDHLQLTGSGDQPLIPANRGEAAIPKLMSVLTVLLPQASNSELHALASTMAGKLQALEGPGKVGNGSEDEEH